MRNNIYKAWAVGCLVTCHSLNQETYEEQVFRKDNGFIVGQAEFEMPTKPGGDGLQRVENTGGYLRRQIKAKDISRNCPVKGVMSFLFIAL